MEPATHLQPKTMNSRSWVRALAVLAVLLIVAVAAALWMSSSSDNDPAIATTLDSIVTPGAAAGYNVLLVTLDTTRPERLGCYGYKLASTPTIDALAKHGLRHDDMVTPVPLTAPSHASLLTGCYPPKLGVRLNGLHRLTEDHTTLAELLRDHGYTTAAFVSCFVLDARFGLDQGFDVYEFSTSRRSKKGPVAIAAERFADDVTSASIQWLRDHTRSENDKPFMLWVHYYDPHHPYEAPIGNTDEFANRPYDAEIAYVDRQLERLIKELDNRQLRKKTLIALVTDHGESLYEHDEAYHGIFLYESTIPVGFILSSPTLFDRAYRSSGHVASTVDLAPTLLDLLGIDSSLEADGLSLFDPESRAADRAVYIETHFPLTNACSPLYGLRRHKDKFILAPEPEYYDLTEDPHEQHNLYTEPDTDADALAAKLDELRASWSDDPSSAAVHELTAEESLALAGLGYAGSPVTYDNQQDLPDPKKQIHVINQMTEVNRLLATQQFDEAERLAREVAVQSPGWDAPVMSLAQTYAKRSDLPAAIRVLKDFAEQHRNARVLMQIAGYEFEAERYQQCLDTLKAAQICDPKMGAIMLVRGDVYKKQKLWQEALAEYEHARKVDGHRLGTRVDDRIREIRELLRRHDDEVASP